jgi:uncharacterized protein YjiK
MEYLFKTANLWLTIIALSCFSCKDSPEKDKYPSIPGYDLKHPTRVELKANLDEISGIYYYPKDTSVFAINDENGILFKIYIRKNVVIKQWKFSNDADYEDLALVDSTFFALHSNGNISKFKFSKEDSFSVEECDIPLKGKNEFESLYFDPNRQKLVALCKDCRSDKHNVPAYAFDPRTKDFENTPVYTIDAKRILETLEGKEKKFKPSAAAIHPVTKELYIISSVNKAIVVADQQGKVKQVYPIDASMFKQPEGITFTPEGTMLISNEFADEGDANILIFKYKGQRS